MSNTALRVVTFALCTIPEISGVAQTNNSRTWAWKHGADVFTEDQVSAVRSHVLRKLAGLNKLAPDAMVQACA